MKKQFTYENYTSLNELKTHISSVSESLSILVDENIVDSKNLVEFFELIKNLNLGWIIFIGDKSDTLEEDFDSIIELASIEDERLLNIVTVHHKNINEIDEIVSEFLHEFIYHENSEVRYISLLDLKSPNSFQINMRVKELIM
jgi:hypothetical protein